VTTTCELSNVSGYNRINCLHARQVLGLRSLLADVSLNVGRNMKITSLLLLTLLLSPLCHGIKVHAVEYGFSATFPSATGWSSPQHPTFNAPQILSWSAKNDDKREMIHVAIIDVPLPDKKPTFKERALEWEKSVLFDATKRISSLFTKLGGIDSYQVTGKSISSVQVIGTLMHEDREYFFCRWMSQIGDVTYQIAIFTEKEPNLKSGIFHDFIQSIKIQK